MRYLLKIIDKNAILKSVNADFSNFTVDYSFKENKARLRFGEVVLVGNDYDLVSEITTRLAEFILYENGVVLGIGNIDLFTKKNIDFKTCSLKLNNLDIYSKFDKYGDDLFNINEVVPVKNVYYSYSREIEYTNQTYTDLLFETSYDSGESKYNMELSNFRTVTNKENQGYFISVAQNYNLIIACCNDIGSPPCHDCCGLVANSSISPWNLNPILKAGTTIVHYQREVAKGFYSGGVAIPPQISGTWIYLEDRSYNGVVYPIYFKQIPSTYTKTDRNNLGNCHLIYGVFGEKIITQAVENSIINQIDYSLVFRKVTDVIKFLVGRIDILISFDNSGTINDSFYSFNEFEGESLIKSAVSDGVSGNYNLGNKLYKDLMICNVTDFLPTSSGLQKNNPATLTNISFNRLISYFKENGFVWYLETRGGAVYFKLVHYLHLDYYNSNLILPRKFTFKTREITPILPTFNKIKNEKRAFDTDFVGSIIEFPDVIEDADLILSDNNVFSDCDNIFFSEDEFSETENDNVLIVATGEGHVSTGSNYIIRDATGEVSGLRKNNSELSFSFLAENYYSEFPDEKIKINEIEEIVNLKRLAKKEKIELSLPIKNIKEDYPINFKVKYLIEMINIDSFKRTGYDNFCKLTIIK